MVESHALRGEEQPPLRATTYCIVAFGQCPICKEQQVNLQFCYNPYGDDELMCEVCADQRISYFEEHSKNE